MTDNQSLLSNLFRIRHVIKNYTCTVLRRVQSDVTELN